LMKQKSLPLRITMEGSIDPDSHKTQFARAGCQHQECILASLAAQRIDALLHIVGCFYGHLANIDDDIAGFDTLFAGSGPGRDIKNRNAFYIFGNTKLTADLVAQLAELHPKYAWSSVALLVLFRRIRHLLAFVSAFTFRKRSLVFRRSLGALVVL